mgnify:FL=1
MAELEARIEGSNLVLVVPLEGPRPSSTGKMNLRYTSGGVRQVLPNGLRVNLTVAEYPKR